LTVTKTCAVHMVAKLDLNCYANITLNLIKMYEITEENVQISGT